MAQAVNVSYSALELFGCKYGAGVHQWDVRITEMVSFARVSHHSGQEYKSNTGIGGLLCGDSIPTNNCTGEALYLLATYSHLRNESRQRILVHQHLHMDKHVILPYPHLFQYLPMQAYSQVLGY